MNACLLPHGQSLNSSLRPARHLAKHLDAAVPVHDNPQ